ncbi:MAG: flippase-like domain-containing protein [Saprospiraceae bacterium]|nr:MAG: flippase-like domain-containing protein [Saprospiraceae bacterium]
MSLSEVTSRIHASLVKKILFNTLQFLVFLSIGAIILYLVFRQQNAAFLEDCSLRGIPHSQCSLMDKLITDFRNARFGWIGLVLAAFVMSNYNRTMKWLILVRPLGYKPRFINGFLAILVGYFANLGLPRMGEVVRAGLFSKYEHIPVEKVMGTIVVDRVVDILCLALAFGLALLFEYDKLWGYAVENANRGGSISNHWWWILAGLLVAAVSAFWIFRKKMAPTALYWKVVKIFAGFWEGILSVRRLEHPGLFIFHSLSIWFLYFLMTWLGFQAFEPTAHLGLQAALTVFAFGTLGMVIPSPGGMGTFHALVIAALTLFYGIRGDDAFSVANIIFFSVSIGFNIVLGLLSLILLPLVNRPAANV